MGRKCFVNVKLLSDYTTNSTMDRKRNTKAKGKRNLRQKASTSRNNIPRIRSNVIVNHRFRFSATAAIAGSSITADNVLGTLGVIGTVVNTTAVQINRSFRISKLEIWSPSLSNAVSTCSVDWASAVVQSTNLEFSDTTINVSEPAYISCRPPKQSLASFWQLSSSNVLFTLNCPIGSIVDMHVESVLNDSATVTTVALAAVALGAIYYLSLNAGTNTLVPVSLRTTT